MEDSQLTGPELYKGGAHMGQTQLGPTGGVGQTKEQTVLAMAAARRWLKLGMPPAFSYRRYAIIHRQDPGLLILYDPEGRFVASIGV